MRITIFRSVILAVAVLLTVPQFAEAQAPREDARVNQEQRDRQEQREARQERQADRQQDAREAPTEEADRQHGTREAPTEEADRRQGARQGQVQEADRRQGARQARVQEADRRQGARQGQVQEADRRQGARQGQVQEAGRGDARAPRRRGAVAPHQARTPQQRGGQAGGPMFCRTGQGHPVYGMQWCHDKRFETPTWRPGSIGDVIIGRETQRRGTIGGLDLETILGRTATRTAREIGAREGLTGDVVGTWLNSRTLEVSVDTVPLVRLVDTTGDGRFDQTLVAQY